MEVLPGDPAEVMLGLNAQPDTLAALRAQMGLDRPAPERFITWVLAFLSGDLGISYTYDVPVATLIGERMVSPASGVDSHSLLDACHDSKRYFVRHASRTPRRYDHHGDCQLGVAVPNFWFAMLLILLFAVTLGWTSAGGFPGFEDGSAALAPFCCRPLHLPSRKPPFWPASHARQ